MEAAVYDEFLAHFADLAAAQIVGDPMDEHVQLGPCARDDLRATVHEQVSQTLARGARLVTGGKFVERPGYFYEPTVVAGVLPGMEMFDEEVFGPAAALVRADEPRARAGARERLPLRARRQPLDARHRACGAAGSTHRNRQRLHQRNGSE